jgi:hypothetical protein
MPLLTQYASFFVSPFGEKTVCDELNAFLKSNRIVNVEKRLIDGERGTGWIFFAGAISGKWALLLFLVIHCLFAVFPDSHAVFLRFMPFGIIGLFP